MPSDHGLRPDHDEHLLPPAPEAGEDRPQRPIKGPERGALLAVAEAGGLVPQGEVLGDQVGSVLEDGDDDRDHEGDLQARSVAEPESRSYTLAIA